MARVVSPLPMRDGPDAQGVVFTNGVAEINEPELVDKYRAAGFGIDAEPGPVLLGSPLRDASVDPRPGDVAPRPVSPRRR